MVTAAAHGSLRLFSTTRYAGHRRTKSYGKQHEKAARGRSCAGMWKLVRRTFVAVLAHLASLQRKSRPLGRLSGSVVGRRMTRATAAAEGEQIGTSTVPTAGSGTGTLAYTPHVRNTEVATCGDCQPSVLAHGGARGSIAVIISEKSEDLGDRTGERSRKAEITETSRPPLCQKSQSYFSPLSETASRQNRRNGFGLRFF